MSTLTANQIKGLSWSGKNQKVNCGNNLYIDIREKSKTWLYRGTINGKRTFRTIGSYPAISLTQAKKMAYEMKYKPTEQRKHKFKELTEDYLNEITYKKMDDLKRKVAYLDSKFGYKDINEISTFELVEFIREYRQRSTSMANHYLIHLRKIFDHAVGLGWLEINPAKAIPRSATGFKDNQKDRVLTEQEIVWLFKQDAPNARVLRFLLLTGLRITEALTGVIDDDKFYVTAKGGNEHWVYLTDTAKDQLPLPKYGRSTIPQWCIRKHLGYTPHDCRRSFATLANDNGAEPFVVERVLAHKLQGVMAVYNRAEYEKERIECAGLVERVVLDIIERGE